MAETNWGIEPHSIRDLIYIVRNTQVMLDSDLAILYGVETKALNQAVTRNIKRFPERFCFRLEKEEAEIIRSQIVTLYPDSGERAAWWRYPPRVFTEQGVSMLSAVLRSDKAVEISVQIMDAFVEMRRFVARNSAMFEQIRAVELRQLEYQKTTDERFKIVFDCMGMQETPKQKIFFDGQVYDAFQFFVEVVRKASHEIVLIDSYVDAGTLNILAKKVATASVVIWTHPNTSLTQRDVDTFNAQYPSLVVRHTTTFHDRFLILDSEEAYLVGASLKDAGKKSFAISRIEDEDLIRSVLDKLDM